MQNIYLLISFGVCFLILSVSGETKHVCFPIDTTGASVQSSTPTQNCPGNTAGPPGPKGDPGDPGNCSCNPNEIEQLREEISLRDERIDRIFQILWQINDSSRVSFCGVGMKDGRVGNDQISASSTYDGRYLPKFARLDRIGTLAMHGGWLGCRTCRNPGQWIQVDLLTPTRIVGVVTQGLNYPGSAGEWTRTYKISYGNVTNSMQIITNSDGEEIIFTGNTDNNSHVTNDFPTAITARYIRLIVQTWNSWGVVRLEYLVC